MSKRNWVESPAIVGLYKVINTNLPILHSKIGTVDLRKITLEQADKIFASGTRYLTKVRSDKDSKTKQKGKEL